VVNIGALLRAIDGFDGQPTMSLTNRGGLDSRWQARLDIWPANI